MKRLFTLAVVALLLLPLSVFAQDDRLKFDLDLDSYVDVTDLGFRFYYPEGWIFDNTQGVTLIENESDVEPLIDGDDSTNAEGLFMRVLGISAASIDGYEDLTLDELVDELLTQFGANEIERVEVGVMARRSISVVGDSANGRAGILSAWKQPDYLVVTTLSAPDMDAIVDLGYSWGVVLGLIEPLNALPLGEDVLTAPEAGLTMPYPEGWIVNPENPGMVAENEADFTSSTIQGGALLMLENSLEGMGMEADTTLEDFSEQTRQGIQMDEPTETSEMVILGQPAQMIKGQDTGSSDGWGLLVTTIIDGQGVVIVMFAPDEETLDGLEPTLISMLKSVRSTEAA